MTVLYLFIRDVVDQGPSQGYKIIIIGTIFTFLATCGMIARFASVRMMKGSFGVAEGLILISFVSLKRDKFTITSRRDVR